RAISQVLQYKAVPCIVRELSDEMASAIMLAENTGRQDLNPIEEAHAYHRRMTAFGWGEDEVADVAGVSKDLVRKRVKLLSLLPEAQQLVATGNLPLGHAECMTKLDRNRQLSALRILQSSAHPLTAAAFRAICQQ